MRLLTLIVEVEVVALIQMFVCATAVSLSLLLPARHCAFVRRTRDRVSERADDVDGVKVADAD